MGFGFRCSTKLVSKVSLVRAMYLSAAAAAAAWSCRRSGEISGEASRSGSAWAAVLAVADEAQPPERKK